MEINMKDFSNLVGRTVFGSKPGDCIPILYLVGDDIDPNEPEGCYSVKATECQRKANEYFCDEYLNINLILCVAWRGDWRKPSQDRQMLFIRR